MVQNGSVEAGADVEQSQNGESGMAATKSDQLRDQSPSRTQRLSNNAHKRQLKDEALARVHKRRSLETSPEAGHEEDINRTVANG